MGQRDFKQIPSTNFADVEIARSVSEFFQSSQTQEALDHFDRVGVEVQPMPRGTSEQPLVGKTFVFTGALDHFTRNEAQRRVELLGGRATSSVSGETDYVVVGHDPGSKLEDARQQGVATVDESEFEEMLE